MTGGAISIREICYAQTKQWILFKHYARRMPSVTFAFGAFRDMSMIGVVTYGSPASPFLCKGVCGEQNRLNVIELNRLVTIDGEKNLASLMISRTLKMLPGGLVVVSYADSAMGHTGYVYQASNWIYTGATKARTDMKSDSGHSRHNGGVQSNRQDRSSKHRYVTFTGNRRERKRLRKMLKYPEMQYPKGENSRYDDSFRPLVQVEMFDTAPATAEEE